MTKVNIVVNGLAGPRCTIEAPTEWTVFQVQEAIAEKLDVAVGSQTLIKDKEKLQWQATVGSLVSDGMKTLELALLVQEVPEPDVPAIASRALESLELHFFSSLRLLSGRNRERVEEPLTQLVALGASRLLNSDGVTRATVIEKGPIRTTPHAVLLAHYTLALIDEADQCPHIAKEAMRLEELLSPKLIEELAALVWDKKPEAASRVPCITRLLRLETGTAEAHFVLGRRFSRRVFKGNTFRDLGKAEHHFWEAWGAVPS